MQMDARNIKSWRCLRRQSQSIHHQSNWKENHVINYPTLHPHRSMIIFGGHFTHSLPWWLKGHQLYSTSGVLQSGVVYSSFSSQSTTCRPSSNTFQPKEKSFCFHCNWLWIIIEWFLSNLKTPLKTYPELVKLQQLHVKGRRRYNRKEPFHHIITTMEPQGCTAIQVSWNYPLQ